MAKNMSGMDGLIRTMVGLVLAVLYFTDVFKGNTGITLFLAGGTLIFTSMESFCPVYALFGIHTRHVRKELKAVGHRAVSRL